MTESNSGARRIAHSQSGQVLILTAAMLPLLIGVTGLAVDVGMLYHHKRRMQTAVDAAAMAGASEMMRNRFTQIVSSGRAGSTTNGFTHGGNTIVNVYHPPITGFYVGNTRYVEAQLTQPSPTYFMQVFGWSQVTIAARAVAGAGANGSYCVYVLDPSMPSAYEGSHDSKLDANCGVMVNSTNAMGLHTHGNAVIDVAHISVTGNYAEDGNSSIDPTPNTGVPSEPDPLAWLPAPAWSGCNHTTWVRESGFHTLNPGVYCNGIRLANVARAHMNPGMYIINGGGLTLEKVTQLTGTGVTIYLTGGSSYAYKGVQLEQNTQIRLSAPTTGTYAGIVFFQDRNASSSVINNFEAQTNSFIEGAMYFSTQILRLHSDTLIDAKYTLIVCRVLKIEQFANFKVRNDYSSLAGGSPIKKLSLVE
jgi:hypothetical protein